MKEIMQGILPALAAVLLLGEAVQLLRTARRQAAQARRESELQQRLQEIEERVDALETACLPQDSAARKAKAETDRFNTGLFNLLSYGGTER